MSVRVLQGHVLDVLAQLPERSVHTACTSPPYWQLRAYGTEPQVWQCEDGDALCAPEQHEWGDEVPGSLRGGSGTPTDKNGRGEDYGRAAPKGAFCAHCHAWRGELGQEPTPELFVLHLVQVFRAVRRVLRDDGTLFVNLAGCYWSDPGGQNGSPAREGAFRGISNKAIDANRENGRKEKGRHPVYKPLDYVDIPGLVARALQEDGWIWRADITWVKPSPLPESVSGTRWEKCRRKVAMNKHRDPQGRGGQQRMLENPEDNQGINPDWLAIYEDCPGCAKCSGNQGLILRRGSGRPTKSTEAVLLFAKQPGYFYDTEAVREPVSEASLRDGRTARAQRGTAGEYGAVDGNCGFNPAGRNQRDAWTIGPEPLKDEHYAAYPTELVARCVKAGSSERGCCPACGAPWARVVEPSEEYARFLGRSWHDHTDDAGEGQMQTRGERAAQGGNRRNRMRDEAGMPLTAQRATTGWRPTCRCGQAQPPVPCRVLDCFGGSGTTGIAADRLGRDCTLVELKPAYAALAERRLNRDAPLLMWGAVSLEGAVPGAEGEAAG